MTLSFIWALVAICSWDLQPEKFGENWRITFGKLSYFKKTKRCKKRWKNWKECSKWPFWEDSVLVSYLWLLNLNETLECRGFHCLFTVRLPGFSSTIHRQKSTKTCKKVYCGGLFGWNWWEFDIGEQRKKKHPKNSKGYHQKGTQILLEAGPSTQVFAKSCWIVFLSKKTSRAVLILLMEEILHQLICS